MPLLFYSHWGNHHHWRHTTKYSSTQHRHTVSREWWPMGRFLLSRCCFLCQQSPKTRLLDTSLANLLPLWASTSYFSTHTSEAVTDSSLMGLSNSCLLKIIFADNLSYPANSGWAKCDRKKVLLQACNCFGVYWPACLSSGQTQQQVGSLAEIWEQC